MGYFVHGETFTRLYRIWLGMKQRCNKPACKEYKWYGAKGIKICPEWAEDFVAFRDWAHANGYKEHLTLERADGAKDYSPDNCSWITNAEQANNRSDNRRVTAFGETKNAKQWSIDERCKVSYPAILKRLNERWTAEDAIATPPRQMPLSKRKNRAKF